MEMMTTIKWRSLGNRDDDVVTFLCGIFLYVAPFSDMFSRDFNILRDEGQNGQVWSCLFAFGSVPAVRSETDGGCWGSRHSVTCLQRGPG